MNFEKFIQTQYEHREEFIPMPELADFFEDGEAPGLTVRGLSAREYFLAKSGKDEKLVEIAERLVTGKAKDVADGISNLLAENASADMRIRIGLFRYGLVKPAIPMNSDLSLEFALRMADRFPVEFIAASEKVWQLTGMGQVVKKKPVLTSTG